MTTPSGLLPDRSIDDLIADRDQAQDMADRLAEALAKLLGVEIGEHSSENDPWANALAAAADNHARPAEACRVSRALYDEDPAAWDPDPDCAWPNGVCTCGQPEGHQDRPADETED